jgi:putative component of toxin-antitoxin plasmid stabilization module
MFEIRKTDAFDKWLTGLADKKTRERILARIIRVSDKDTQNRDVKLAEKLAKGV